MQCLQCHKENKAGRKFCSACGSALPLPCSACGFANEPDDQFCGGCGKAIVPIAPAPFVNPQSAATPKLWTPHHLAERILAAQTARATRADTDGERKTITALFADVAGFTTLTQALDPEDTRQLIDPALHLMMDAVHRYDGYVAQSLGDGIFALFGAPLAHEDHAQRALYAALRMQEEMRHYADRLRLEGGIPLQIRVGINSGEVVLRSIRKDDLHVDYVPVGHSTNLASRMESLATPGSIIVSHHTYKLIEGYFKCKFLGEAQVKGVDQPVPIYEVLSAGPLRTRLQVAARRGLTRFVGRHREMEQMQRSLAQAQAGHGQIVGVMGEPGLGKSRLFYEFVGAYCNTPLPAQSACLVLQAYSVSHGKASPYLPVIELLKSYFQLQPQDDERTRREKIGGKVLMLDRNLEDTLPYLFVLLGIADPQTSLQQMDPQIRQRRTFDALKRLFLRESLSQPLLLIFEDLHWIDSETQGFLDTLSESIASTRMLLLVNYRPEYRHAWDAMTYYTQLYLAPFGKAEAEEFLDELLGATTVETLHATSLQRLKQLILDKTEGTPFFMEEIVQELVEQGVLIRDGVSTGLTPAPPLRSQPDLHIPATVQGVLAARIDRLTPDEKVLLQQLAVIGREFPLSLVKHVIAQPEDDLHRLLLVLQHKEFLYGQPVFLEVEYVFKHALTQEVAYNSVLIERRKILHAQTAQAIEQLYHDRLEEHYSQLAHHYSHSSDTEKAVTYLQKAGQQAAQRSAHTEAISHLTFAIELLGALSDTPEHIQLELDVQLALAASLQATRGPSASEVEHAYTRAQELLQHQEETPQLFSVLRGLWVLQHVRANLTAAREIGEQLCLIAERTQDAAFVLEAHRALGSTLLWLGEFSSARSHLEHAMSYYDQQLHHALTLRYGGADPGVSCLCELARVLWFLGYPDQALQRSQAALTLAQNLADPYSLSYAYVFAAGLHQLRREGQPAQHRAEAGIALAQEHGFSALVSAGTIRQGWAIAEQGEAERGLQQIQRGLAARQTARAELAQPYFLALQSEICGKLGKLEQAMTFLSEALTAMSASEEHRLEAELYRLKGELVLQSSVQRPASENLTTHHLAPSTHAEAERYFLKAIAIAQKQQARSLELRTVMSLVRLQQQQTTQHTTRDIQHETRSRLAEAHKLLLNVYNWFTEGFDTKDLHEAKVRIEELGH